MADRQPILVHQRPEEATRTAGKVCKWVAEAIVNGRTYIATSRMAPVEESATKPVRPRRWKDPATLKTELGATKPPKQG